MMDILVRNRKKIQNMDRRNRKKYKTWTEDKKWS